VAQVVGERQDVLLAAGKAERFPQGSARRVTGRDVQHFHGHNYTMSALRINQIAVALQFRFT
jgi:hypothetical protein